MKIVCISDTHSLHDQVKMPEGDMVIFAGDFMTSGYEEQEVRNFQNWFSNLDYKYRIMIAGNHDRYVENYPDMFKKGLPSNIIYLEDSFVEVEGLKIYGTPHSKIFGNWAFNRSEFKLEQLFENIPEDTDILISHAPQLYVLDNLMDGRNVGEYTLAKRITKLKNLKLHVVGHIHNAFGMIKPHGEYITVNAAQVDETYVLKNFPIVVNI